MADEQATQTPPKPEASEPKNIAEQQLPDAPDATKAEASESYDKASEKQMREAYNRLAGIAEPEQVDETPDQPGAISGPKSEPKAKEGEGEAPDTSEGPAETDARTDSQGESGERPGERSGEHPLAESAKKMLGSLGSWTKKDPRTGQSKLDAVDDAQAVEAAREASRQALKRWKYPDEVIDQFPEDRLFELGAEAAEAQANQNRNYEQQRREKENLRQLLAEIERERQEANSPDDAQEGQPRRDTQEPQGKRQDTPPQDEGDGLDPLLEVLIEDGLIYERQAEPIRQRLAADRQRQQQTIAELRKQLEDTSQMSDQKVQTLEQKLNDLYLQQDRLRLDQVRRQLWDDEQFPELKQDDVFQQVQSRVYQLANLNGYRSESGEPLWEKLVADAARLEGLGHLSKDKVQAKLQKRYRAQQSGQPEDEAPASETESMDEDEAMRRIHNMIAQGKNPEQARQWVQKHAAIGA